MIPPRSVDLQEAQRELQTRLACEVRCDPLTRVLYSTDASVYQIEPLGVAFPRHEDDLQAIVEGSASLGVPILARGAGTSLAGQAVTHGLVIDCSRYLTRIHGLDRETHQVTAAPGVVGAAVNAAAARHGFMIGPDPASLDRATIGGMFGNNATGAHSIRYGMLGDHVLSADVILSDGTQATFGSVTEERARQIAQGPGLEASIYRQSLQLRQEAASAVRRHWPRIWRRASGYSLERLVGYSPGKPPGWYADPQPYPPYAGFNLAPVLSGSEGTLAVVRRLVLNLVPRPAATVLVILRYDSLQAACEATPPILETHPAAVELIPRVLLERAQAVPEYARKAHAFGEHAAALLVVEYAGESAAAARAAADRLHQPGTQLEDAGDQADLWAVRKVGLGLLMSVPGDTKPLSFIEDVSVPVERLGDYVRRMDRLLAGHDTRGEWYAHASAGCLHLRPLINLKQPAGRAQMRSIAEGALEIVLELGGVLSGEHGDGISHAGFNERLFGPELTQAFRQLKHAFDPNGLLNPGKIVCAEGQAPPPMDTSLRYDASYQTQEWPTVFRFSRQGGLARAIEDCSGAGVCLKADGVMCPSYQALRQEAHSTRGRANALRAAISGRLGPGAMTSEELRGVLDLCLACKGCKAECPSAVDMARIKAEILAYDHRLHGIPLRSRLFGEIARLSQLARPVAGPVNTIARLSITRRLMERLLGISRHRVMPAFAARTFRQWFAGRAGAAQGEPVVLFVDTFVEHNHPQVGRAAVRVLEACGYRVELAPDQVCCGRAMISKGLLDRARQMAAHNLDALFPLAERGVPIVGLEPSCVATLRDEYLDFFPDDPRTGVLAESALLLEELLTIPGADGRRPVERVSFHAPAAELWVHGHCHAKALTGTVPLLEMLRATGARVREIECGCCGMAGSFGYEVEHYDLSMQIGEMQLFPAVRQAASRGGLVVAAGTSCRAQIQDGTGVKALHPAEVLAMAIQDEKP